MLREPAVTVVWPQHEANELQNNIETNYNKTLALFQSFIIDSKLERESQDLQD